MKRKQRVRLYKELVYIRKLARAEETPSQTIPEMNAMATRRLTRVIDELISQLKKKKSKEEWDEGAFIELCKEHYCVIPTIKGNMLLQKK